MNYNGEAAESYKCAKEKKAGSLEVMDFTSRVAHRRQWLCLEKFYVLWLHKIVTVVIRKEFKVILPPILFSILEYSLFYVSH